MLPGQTVLEAAEGCGLRIPTACRQGLCGTCLVRILFEDGRQRTFGNDLDAETCCYYFGMRKYWSIDANDFAPVTRKRPARRQLR